MGFEELVNHNHTPGRGHPNLGGHDAHVGKEVAVGMRGGRSFDKALAESQHYQLHRNEIATLPKRARRELHRHILGIANAHERAQGYPGHAFAAEEFYNKVHSKESGQFAPPNAAAVTAVKNAKAQGKKEKDKDAKATKKPDTSDWHRDRLIADALAKLKSGSKSSGGGTSSGPVTGKLREQSKLKSNKPKNAAIKIPKPKAVKASAAYAAVEEFYNHHHSPADGRFTGTTYSAGGTTPGGISKYRTNRVGLGNGLYPSKMRDQDAKSRKYHELQDLKVKRREKRHLGWFALPEKSVAAAAKAVEEFINHNHTPTSAHPNAGGSWTKVTAGKYSFGSAVVEQVSARAFGKTWTMRVNGKRIDVPGGVSTLKSAKEAVEGYLHGQAGTPDSTRMSPVDAPLFKQTDYHRGFVKGNANVPVITAAEARGDSRPVSHEEFQRLAAVGRAQLDAMRSGSSPTTGLDARWEAVKSETYAKAQESWGGATIDSHTGVEVPQGANVYALTVKGHGVGTVSVPEGASAAEFNAAMDKAKAEFGPILERAGHHLGVFHDDATHRIDIDPVIVTANHADVETIGAASHAIGGAYNFADGNGYFPPHVPEPGVSLAVDEFAEEFRAGRSPYSGNPKSIGGRSPSLKWPHLYDILQAKGYDKEASAAISNSRVWMRKNGQLGGLPWAKADNKKALKGVLTKYKAKHGHEAAADAILEFVNHNHTPGRGHPNAGGTVAEAKARAAAVPAGKIVNPQVAENIAALKFHHGPGGRQDQLRGQHYSQFHDGRPVADCPNCKADKEHFDSLSPEAQIAWRRAN